MNVLLDSILVSHYLIHLEHQFLLVANLHQTAFPLAQIRQFTAKAVHRFRILRYLLVKYESVLETPVDYIQTRVKIEIGCLAMDEPTEQRKIDTIISKYFPDEDNELACTIRTAIPTRTFLEKMFLLNEEFQKSKPRYKRMSRHLYDLERLMDTKYGIEAIADTTLYNSIVEHRKAYYDLKYIDYSLHAPEKIDFIPPKEEIEKWRNDYDEMQRNFIFGAALPFDELLQRMKVLKNRIRQQSSNLS